MAPCWHAAPWRPFPLQAGAPLLTARLCKLVHKRQDSERVQLLSSGSVAPCRRAWVDLASQVLQPQWLEPLLCLRGPLCPRCAGSMSPRHSLGVPFHSLGLWHVCGWPACAVSVSAHSTSLQQYLHFSLKALLFCHCSQLCISCVCCEAGVTSPILRR